jgi:MFS family permease
VSVLLAQYLTDLGFTPLEIGAIVTGTLLGSAAMTLLFGLGARSATLKGRLLLATFIMALTGGGFATVTWFWPLLIIAVLGTLNPSAGDVSVFLPTEQAYVAGLAEAPQRPRIFAIYNLAAIFAGAIGALVSSIPEALAGRMGVDVTTAQRMGFVLYAAAAVVIFFVYVGLRPDDAPALDSRAAAGERRGSLHSSRRIVLELAGLFSIDSAGSGFVVTSLLVLWLHLRFDMSPVACGTLFFAAGLLGACSQALAPRLARRIGLIRTMVFTHIPANVLLILAAFAPSGSVAVVLLLARALFAQMDVPARQSFVMAVVPAEERAAASSVTNVPRSLASAVTPLFAGLLLARSTFGWPLVIAGSMKIAYDLILLVLYREVPEEVGARRTAQKDRHAPSS